MTRLLVFLIAASLLLLAMPGCSTAPKSVEGKANIESKAANAIDNAQKNDPSLSKFFREAVGCAVFPTVGKGAIGVGAAYGKGVLYENGTAVGYCDLSQASIGFQLGGQGYTEIIFFETSKALDHFKSGNYAFDAQASAVALKSGAGANAKYSGGVAVFTMDEAGLMYEASIGGQKFSYLAK